MSVYKELRVLYGQIERQTQQIWPDSADAGVEVQNSQDPLLKQIADAIKSYDGVVETTDYGTGMTKKITFTGGMGMFLEAGFEKLVITFVRTRSDKKVYGYVYVEAFYSQEIASKAMKYDY